MIVSRYRAGTSIREDVVLGCLGHMPARPIELARFLARPLSEVETLVHALRERGLVSRREDGRYILEVGEEGET